MGGVDSCGYFDDVGGVECGDGVAEVVVDAGADVSCENENVKTPIKKIKNRFRLM